MLLRFELIQTRIIQVNRLGNYIDFYETPCRSQLIPFEKKNPIIVQNDLTPWCRCDLGSLKLFFTLIVLTTKHSSGNNLTESSRDFINRTSFIVINVSH